MSRLVKLSEKVFTSDPKNGYIGSMELNIWLAQLSGVPIIGLKTESFSLKFILCVYGGIVLVLMSIFYTGFELYDAFLNLRNLDVLTQNFCLSLTHVSGLVKVMLIWWIK